LITDNFVLRLNTRVARLGSCSAAARECGLSQSQASRIVADLKGELGVRLLSRTTRAVVPTEAGGEFLARVEPILAALDEAEHSVGEGRELRGLLRMSMPTSFGVRDVIPRLASFAERHPNLHIQLQLSDRRQDWSKTPWTSRCGLAGCLTRRPRRSAAHAWRRERQTVRQGCC
jgi:DNA-binding transcriptional LysR family regulator